MKTTQSFTGDVERKTYWRRLSVLIFAVACIFLSSYLRDKLLIGHAEPGWLRLAIVAGPWLVFGLCLLFYRRLVWCPDEMETLISHRAIVFAFYVMIAGVLLIDQLQTVRLIPAFEWTADRLFMTMGGLVATGILWNKIRFSW